MNRPSVLLVDDEPLIRIALSDSLDESGLAVAAAANGAEGMRLIGSRHFDVAVLDLRLPDMSGLDLLRELGRRGASTDVVMITAHGDIPAAVEAMKLGARDFLTKPFETATLLETIQRYLKVRLAKSSSLTLAAPEPVCCGMVGGSPPMQELYRVIRAVADGGATILITGETGTGKELVANAIHTCSVRSKGPLVKLNCASIPEPLFESELYGHERGAFTGADRQRKGHFELADRGTLFLDEVDEIPMSLQAKLLRSIQEKEVQRLGSATPTRVDVRVVAASKVDLLGRVAAGRFREDLYYRLAVLPIRLPPLRERGEDVQLLAEHFLWCETRDAGKPAKTLSGAARNALGAHDWPGNVRELANVVARAVAMSPAESIEPAHLGLEASSSPTPRSTLSDSIQAEEDRRIDEALAQTNGRKAEAAELLGISRKTLWEKLKRREPR
ncbi:MAG: sigma-54-dependent Fis family transcriptional regulator [Polyangiaceae bacterium]|nr:sigma-54-dependent Fis family transcriptional regulator [Polyangiaceae bacterium]MCE7890732.1 sigma-54-dependent Fis family transcriptional regulator [Sorangiineae bacterium PRO1]MCL4750798.1 sigma-54 dependent transcriptional regulator [Myxococcales bacterium]